MFKYGYINNIYDNFLINYLYLKYYDEIHF